MTRSRFPLRWLLPFFLLTCGVVFANEPAKPNGGSSTQPVEVVAAAVMEELTGKGFSCAFSPDGKRLAVGSEGAVELFEVPTGKPVRKIPFKKGAVRSIAWLSDARHLVAGAYQAAAVLDATAETPESPFAGHRGYVTSVAVSPDHKRLATACEDELVRVYEIASRELVRTLRGHEYPVNAVAWSPDGTRLLSAAGDETRAHKPGEVLIWDTATWEQLEKVVDHQRAVLSLTVTPDGSTWLSGSLDEKVHLHRFGETKAIGAYADHARPVNAIAPYPFGTVTVSASGGRAKGGNEVRIWHTGTGDELAVLGDHQSRVNAVAVSADGRWLASASHDKSAVIWDLKALQDRERPATSDPVTPPASALSPEGRQPTQAPRLDTAAADEPTLSECGEADPAAAGASAEPAPLKIGIIGLDTSHSVAFTKLWNGADPPEALRGCRVVIAYPFGSRTIPSSADRIPGYTAEVEKLGVKIAGSIAEVVEASDAILLETNDGQPHWEQFRQIAASKKPVFVDKPVAASLRDVVAIYELAKRHGTPVFSSSSLRYVSQVQKLRAGEQGKVFGCDAFSPCSLEPNHPDLYWYGIHGVEMLVTTMGPGCVSVQRTSTAGADVMTATWGDGRIGTFRGIRQGKSGYGGTAFSEKGIIPLGGYEGYQPLVVEITNFFRTKEVPVPPEETLEIYAAMSAADESKKQNGVIVPLAPLLEKARAEARELIEGSAR